MGSERYEAMSRIYYRGAKAGIVCYDLTDDASWDRARFWVQEIKGHEEACKIYLCGTKCDLLENGKERAIDKYDIDDYAETINADVFETSSRTGEKISELFDKIAEDYTNRSSEFVEEDFGTVPLNETSPSADEPFQKRFTALFC